ncbi:MAG: hypothetical protein WC332_02155 [Clostridia bacterium]|jgi:hypothetical protein
MLKRIKDYFWYEEGKVANFFAIGWGFSNTSFICILKFPIFIWDCKTFSISNDSFCYGLHFRYVTFYFRIRSKEQCRKSGKKYLFHNQYWWKPINKFCYFVSREEVRNRLTGITNFHLGR